MGADQGLLERMLDEPAIVNGMLIVIAVTTLTFAYRNLRHYPRRSGTRPATGVRSPAPPRRPPALHPDHPSWPGGPDPRWTAFEEAWADDGRG
jgi:hypothetical protein